MKAPASYWQSSQADLTIFATRDGHALSVRHTQEVELLRYLQSDRSKAPRRTADGKERAKPISSFEPRTVAPKTRKEERSGGEGGFPPPPHEGLPGTQASGRTALRSSSPGTRAISARR